MNIVKTNHFIIYSISAFLIISFMLVISPLSFAKSQDYNITDFQNFAANKTTFPYFKSAKDQALLLTKYSKLSTGLSMSEVLSQYGKPDSYHDGYSQNMSPYYMGSCWTYYLEIRTLKDPTSDKNVWIRIYFDDEDKVQWTTSNVTQLKDKGKKLRKDYTKR